ncbi:MAG TPA: hydroxymethylglutaryl-CoA lyase [Rhizomicrobium sp.]
MPRERISVREVGLRDGLQSVAAVMPTAKKCEWLSREHAAGIREFEVTSFVPARLLPQLADADAVVEHALGLRGATVAALVPNLRGAERALAAGVHKIAVVISASESHNRANVHASVADSVAQFRRIVACARATERKISISAGISTAFGCGIEGAVSEDDVLRLAATLAEAGAAEITLADTVGYGSPRVVHALFASAARLLGGLPLVGHFHDTRGLGLANAYAATQAGVRALDASLAGLGGCPYAPGATGNVVTEDLVFMLEACGFDTGVDVECLIGARAVLAEAFPAEPLYGALAKAGQPRPARKE